MKYYLLSSSPELALDIGLNLVRGEMGYIFESRATFSANQEQNQANCDLLFTVFPALRARFSRGRPLRLVQVRSQLGAKFCS